MDHEIVRLLEAAAETHDAAGRTRLARHHRSAARLLLEGGAAGLA